ncbi:MAG: S9 family peptidase [Gemmatimonadota bacterium]|nr:MAG: S9 family peptidase [Gemmatimonadota bacterium]
MAGTPRRTATIAMLALLVTAALAAPAAGQSKRALEVDDLFGIKRVRSPQISPNGEWVAYTVTTTSLEDEKSTTRIWMVSSEGGDPLPMTGEGTSASNPRWSPDGKYLSFTASRNEGKSQVWALDRRGGEARQLTDVKQGISGYVWSPDGTRLLLTIRDPEEKDEDAKKNKPRDPWVIERLQFKRDRQGYLTGDRHSHLYVLDLSTEELTQITSGRWDETAPAWSPDGKRVAFSSNRTEDPDANTNSDLWVVSAENTDQGETLLRLTDYAGPDSQPAWSVDGRWIAYVTGTHDPRFNAYATRKLAVVSAKGGERRILADDLDRNVGNPEFTTDGRGILVSLQESGEVHLARIDFESGRVTRPIGGEVTMSGFSGGAGGVAATVLSTPHRPGEVHLAKNGKLTRLTHVNDGLMNELRLAEVTNIHFPSRDGTEIEGWILTPPGYDPNLRYPTILRIHGGPNGQYGVGFNFDAQLFAANGYVVVITNPRGSSGYGQDFGMALWRKWGIPDFDDVMAGVDYAIEQGYSDPNRLGVGGWSYGGILTNYVITKTERFKAATTGASMALLIANYGVDHYQFGNEAEWGLPWESRDVWERLSPFNDVDKVTTPTLIMGGEKDWNVPVVNSEQLYQALRRRGIDTRLIVYPGQPHGLRVPSYQKDRLQRYLAWYDKYVKNASKPVTD